MSLVETLFLHNFRSGWLALCLLLVSSGAWAVPDIQHWTTARGGRVYFGNRNASQTP